MNFEHLEPFEFVEPGPIARKTLDAARGRTMSLSKLDRVDDLCVWCNVAKLPTKRHRWCSKNCVNSGSLYCNPQHPDAKAIILIHFQDCACRECGVSHEGFIRERINRKAEGFRREAMKRGLPPEMAQDVTFFYVGYNTGSLLEVDHIVPIHLGGRGIGFENVQVICVACHRRKTAREAQSYADHRAGQLRLK